MKAIVTVGVSASGKTTWALEQKGFIILSRDDIRRIILEGKLRRPLLPGDLWKCWKWKDESEVTAVINNLIDECVKGHRDIIIADTNLNSKFRHELHQKLMALGYDVEYKDFPVTFEEAIKRDAGRADGVGHSVIWKQYKQWYEYAGGKVYVPDATKPKAVIFDVDGTLAHMNGKRGPFDWDKVHLDDLREEIAVMYKGFHAAGYFMIVVSGRDGSCRDLTRKWLNEHDLNVDALFMRTAGDMRKDNVVKEEIFFNEIADKYNVKLVVDDRPQVVRQWQLMGLNVAAVANQYEEF